MRKNMATWLAIIVAIMGIIVSLAWGYNTRTISIEYAEYVQKSVENPYAYSLEDFTGERGELINWDTTFIGLALTVIVVAAFYTLGEICRILGEIN